MGTDGKTHKGIDLPILEQIAPEVHKEATVAVIGVGNTPKQKELEIIASEKKYAFRVDDYLSLDRQVTETLNKRLCDEPGTTEVPVDRCDCEHGTGTLVKIPKAWNWPSSFTQEQKKKYFCEDREPCKSCDDNYQLSASGFCEPNTCRKRNLEILIVIDSSSIIDSQDFTRVKELIETLVDKMKLANNLGADKSDISILVYREKGPYFFHFLPLLQRSTGEKETNRFSDIKAASKKLQKYVGDVAAIGLGARPDDSVLKAIATHPYYIYKPFTTGEFDTLNRQIVDTVNKCADDF